MAPLSRILPKDLVMTAESHQQEFQHTEEVRLLRAEIEMLMNERESLLRTAGAAAVFVAKLDSSVLPEETYAAADVLAHALNELAEESLRDALELVRPEFETGEDVAAG